jgi:hypothetical protein
MKTGISASLLCLLQAAALGAALHAQQAEPDRLDQLLNDYYCRTEVLPNQQSPDDRPVVRLLFCEEPTIPNKEEDRLDYVLRHNVVRSASFFSFEDPHLLRRFLARLPDLEEVRTNGSWITPGFLRQLQEVKKLRSLSINLGRAGGPGLEGAAFEKAKRESLAYLGTMQQLRALDLSHSNLTDDDLKPLTGLKNLEELDLSGNIKISDEGLKVIAGIGSLRRLRLRGVAFGDEGLAALTALSNLEQLHLEPLRQEDKDYRQKAGLPLPKLTAKAVRCLEQFAEMRDLSLRTGFPMDPDAGLAFLCKMPKLESLELASVDVEFVGDVLTERKKERPKWKPDVAFSDFSEFAELKRLRQLSLADTPLELAIVEDFPPSYGLETLNLSRVGISGYDVRLLAKKTPNLKSLRMKWVELSGADLLALSRRMKGLQYLEFSGVPINLNGFGPFVGNSSKVTLDELAACKRANPRLTINDVDRLTPWGAGPPTESDIRAFNETLSARAKELDKKDN